MAQPVRHWLIHVRPWRNPHWHAQDPIPYLRSCSLLHILFAIPKTFKIVVATVVSFRRSLSQPSQWRFGVSLTQNGPRQDVQTQRPRLLPINVFQLRHGLHDVRVRSLVSKHTNDHDQRSNPANKSYDAGVLGGVQTTKPFLDAIGNPKGNLIIPLIASSYTLGAWCMAMFLTVSDLGQKFGRRASILGGDVFVIVGGILQATSYCEDVLFHLEAMLD